MTRGQIAELLSQAKTSVMAAKTPNITRDDINTAYLASIACSLLAMADMQLEGGKK